MAFSLITVVFAIIPLAFGGRNIFTFDDIWDRPFHSLNPTNMNTRAVTTQILSNNTDDIHFYLYSDPANPKDFREIFLNNETSLNGIQLAPGTIKFLCLPFNGHRSVMNTIKDAYLSQGVKNVILVDYEKLVKPQVLPPLTLLHYLDAMNNVKLIGTKGAAFINFMVKNKQIRNVDDVHLVGFSLGSHVAASIGRNVQEIMGVTIGRITGLDPAGPFNKKLGKDKFNKGYAKFTDAIHTNIDGFGTRESLAHADFFINGGRGKAQVDCQYFGPILTIPCSHRLAVELFVRSITRKNEFTGCACRPIPSAAYPLRCAENTNGCGSQTMLLGNQVSTGARGNFYIKVPTRLMNLRTLLREIIEG